MYTLQDLIASFEQETAIIKHLATKLPESGLDYKPNEHQRSMRELMYYLTMMGLTMTIVIRDGVYDPEQMKWLREEVSAKDLSAFATLMDEQLVVVKDYLNTVTQDQLDEEINPFGQWATSRKSMIFGMYHKNYTAYRMQFFCYLKDAGAHQLNTGNLWMGRDSK